MNVLFSAPGWNTCKLAKLLAEKLDGISFYTYHSDLRRWSLGTSGQFYLKRDKDIFIVSFNRGIPSDNVLSTIGIIDKIPELTVIHKASA